MIITENIIKHLEDITGIAISEEKYDFVFERLENLLDYIGYSEEIQQEETKTQDIHQTGIDDTLIKYLEELSRLRLSEAEEGRAKGELSKILGYIDMLNELDTDSVEPMSHPYEYTNNFREDEVVASSDRDDILKNAPQQKDGCFKVPTTVE